GRGEGLVFRGDEAAISDTPASALCEVLTRDPPCRLVVLNACSTTAARRLEPFGGIAQRLIENGVGAVVGHQAPVAAGAAQLFAENLYRALAVGATVDVATQAGRRALFARPDARVASPFVVCMTRGAPQAVLAPGPQFDPAQVDRLYWGAVFGEQ